MPMQSWGEKHVGSRPSGSSRQVGLGGPRRWGRKGQVIAVIEPVGPSRPVDGSRRPGSVRRAGKRRRAGSDSVELSGLGKLVAKINASSPLHGSKLAAVRREVADGKYVTPERLHAALENLADELNDLSRP